MSQLIERTTMQYTLTPGYYDVDSYGWELVSDDREISEVHPTFHAPQADDIRAAQAWAAQLLGRTVTWTRVEDPGHDGAYGHHYTTEA
ncbi:hypothetical protein ACIRVF_08210 [Kitasatospora sp. NPDC101157]|uniref:hypothetical protein n=1 Tax=Kitasatospora sp. NPDC101157 TaxID=3364098 RepID=UPI003822524B